MLYSSLTEHADGSDPLNSDPQSTAAIFCWAANGLLTTHYTIQTIQTNDTNIVPYIAFMHLQNITHINIYIHTYI